MRCTDGFMVYEGFSVETEVWYNTDALTNKCISHVISTCSLLSICSTVGCIEL